MGDYKTVLKVLFFFQLYPVNYYIKLSHLSTSYILLPLNIPEATNFTVFLYSCD